MNITFKNQCNHFVVINIDDTEPMLLHPFETKTISRKGCDIVKIRANRNSESRRSEYTFDLVVETEYIFSEVANNAVFTIIREKIRFSENATYDRIFVSSQNAQKETENYRILSEDEIKKAFKKEEHSLLFLDVILEPKLTILLIVVGLAILLNFGWKIAVLYIPFAVVFLLSYIRLADKAAEVISVKAFNKLFKRNDKTEKKEFYEYFENDYITAYYASPNRTPWTENPKDIEF